MDQESAGQRWGIRSRFCPLTKKEPFGTSADRERFPDRGAGGPLFLVNADMHAEFVGNSLHVPQREVQVNLLRG
jgi:hypothetical protein